ncbi:competence regulator inhibitor paratox [Streptococcus dysgalactiae]|uniref:competence regulator inhibitor paratox n=1 Tax=Streptococcus dysgalactiae TaxID=1334 RepID=UPI000F6CB87E|nr:phage protein [Streptococcus dysgalactiae subsp. dysgalactiae]
MLTYDEFKQAINDGYITGDTVAIVRKNGQIFDYVLSSEEWRNCNIGKSGRSVEGVLDLVVYMTNPWC